MARAETGTSVEYWLNLPLIDLPEWCEIIADEQERIEEEINKKNKKRY